MKDFFDSMTRSSDKMSTLVLLDSDRHASIVKMFMTRARVTAFILAVFLLALSGGCSQKGVAASHPDDDQSDNVAAKTPPIYLRQTGLTMENGHPFVEAFYKDSLSKCQKLQGRITVSPIAPDLVDKLGRTSYQIWFEGDRIAIQSKSWGFTQGEGLQMCEFHAVSHARKSIAGAHGAYRINLDKGTATHDSSFAVVRYAIRPKSPSQKAAEAKENAAVMAEMNKQGYAGAVDEAAPESSPAKVAGQPCEETIGPSYGESCIWTGGRQWGFTKAFPSASYITGYDPILANVDGVILPGDSLLLSSAPPDDGVGERLTTQTMTIGKPIEPRVFEVSPNISVQPAND